MRTLRIENVMATISRLCVASVLIALAACGSEEPATPTAETPPPAAVPPAPTAETPPPAAVPTAPDMGAIMETTAEPPADPGARLAQPCLSCHDAEIFAGRGADELVKEMQAIAAGDMTHPPLPVTLSEKDLATIAAYLVAAPAASEP